MPLNTELVSTLLEPVAGDNPAGADLRYDNRVDIIKEARREFEPTPEELRSGVAGKSADWTGVIATTTAMLRESKDLQVAAWLTEALLKRNGIGGLATGVEVLKGIIEKYWDGCYPPIDDDDLELRIGPVEWIGSKMSVPVRLVPIFSDDLTYAAYQDSRSVPTEQEANDDKEKRGIRAEAISQGKLSPEEADRAVEATTKQAVKAVIADLDLAAAAVNALEKQSDERFGRDAPTLNPLRNALEEVKRFANSVLARKLELDPDPIEEVPLEEVAAEVTTDGPQTPEPVSKADAGARIAVIAKWLRQQDPTHPAPYLLVRGYRWGELRAAAPELDPKLLEAPATVVRARLKGLLLDARWNELLEQGEQLMATTTGRAWIDLQRYTLTACANLGAAYEPVANAIRSELRTLLAALPQLVTMTLMDDTPTTNGETREWLEAESLLPSESPADAPAESAEDVPDSDATDGMENLEQALREDQSTAENGGLARARRRTLHSRNGHHDVFDNARAELAGGRPNRAIELLVAELARERSPRGRFVRQAQIAYLMVEAGFDAVAKPILERLIETIEARTLEEWESGPLVAQPIALLVRVYDRMGLDEETRNELYLRVCRLDPLQAIALAGR